MVLLGLLFPAVGLALPRCHIIDVGVVTVMFLGGLRLSREAFRQAASRVPLLLGSLVVVFGLAPLMALGLGELLGLSSLNDRTAVLLCSAQASTLATAIVLTEVAGGDVALAMVMTVVNNAASVLLTPIAFRLFVGAEISVDHWSMSLELLVKIVCPVIAAQGARIWLAAPAKRYGKQLSLVSQIIVLTYVFAGVAAGQRYIAEHPHTIFRVLALVASLHLFLLFCSAVASRVMCRCAPERVAFTLCSAQKTLPAAMLLWKSHFPLLPLGPVVAVAYHMLQLVVDSLLAASFTRLPFIADVRDRR
jgi:sodium/bile acid cotransporter 7